MEDCFHSTDWIWFLKKCCDLDELTTVRIYISLVERMKITMKKKKEINLGFIKGIPQKKTGPAARKDRD